MQPDWNATFRSALVKTLKPGVFPNTSCSQCGCDTGPGLAGHSSCETHSSHYAEMLGIEIDLMTSGIEIEAQTLREISRFIATNFKLVKRNPS